MGARHISMKPTRLLVRTLLALTVTLAACGTTTSGVGDIADLDSLTESYGCGTGFWIGNPDETTALFVSYNGSAPPESTTLPDSNWSVRLVDGQNLFANWCDDVIEEGEPTPFEARSLPVIAGSLEIVGDAPAQFESAPLSLIASDLVLDVGNGETHELGDVQIENPSFGFFAG